MENELKAAAAEGVPLTRTRSKAASINESLYANRLSFLRRAARRVGLSRNVTIKPTELQRISTAQAHTVGSVLARHPSRTGSIGGGVGGPIAAGAPKAG